MGIIQTSVAGASAAFAFLSHPCIMSPLKDGLIHILQKLSLQERSGKSCVRELESLPASLRNSSLPVLMAFALLRPTSYKGKTQ